MLRRVNDVTDVLRDSGFWTAVTVAAVLLAVGAVRARVHGTVMLYAPVVVAATAIGLLTSHLLPAPLVVGGVLLEGGAFVGGAMVGGTIGSVPGRSVCLVPGALVVAAALPDGFSFTLRAVVVIAITLSAPLVAVTAARDPQLTALLVAVSAVGVYVCVPDTEQAEILLGAALVGAGAASSHRLRAVVGIGALIGVYTWTVAVGGHARDGAVVGGLACLGMLVLAPIAAWRRTGDRRPGAILLVHAALVAFVARVAGVRDSAAAATLLALAAAAVAVATAALLTASYRRRPP